MKNNYLLCLLLLCPVAWAAEPDESGMGGTGREKAMPELESIDVIQLPDAVELPPMIELPESIPESFALPSDAAGGGVAVPVMPEPPEK